MGRPQRKRSIKDSEDEIEDKVTEIEDNINLDANEETDEEDEDSDDQSMISTQNSEVPPSKRPKVKMNFGKKNM